MTDPRLVLIRNEQAKLTATYLNGVAIALAAIGAISPIIAAIQGAGAGMPTAVTSVACLLVSVSLHLVARRRMRVLQLQ